MNNNSSGQETQSLDEFDSQSLTSALLNLEESIQKKKPSRKVYCATKFQNLDGFEECAARLRAAGHELTHDWTAESDEGMVEPNRTLYRQNCATNDMNGVLDAEVLVLIPTETRMAGAFVELGIALATGKRILVVDGFNPAFQPNIFYFLPNCFVEHFPTIKAAVDAI